MHDATIDTDAWIRGRALFEARGGDSWDHLSLSAQLQWASIAVATDSAYAVEDAPEAERPTEASSMMAIASEMAQGFAEGIAEVAGAFVTMPPAIETSGLVTEVVAHLEVAAGDMVALDDEGKAVPAARLVYDMPAQIYHARELGVVSNSALQRALKSHAHYKSWVDYEDEEEDDEESEPAALAFGRALHVAVLEPELYASSYVVAPEWEHDGRTREGKAERAAFEAARNGREVINAKWARHIEGMRRSMMQHPKIGALLRGGRSEVTAQWTESGLRCKARADYLRADVRAIVDLKSTTDASPEGFWKSVAKWRYDVQAAHYLSGFAACGVEIDVFAFVACEKVPPYACALYNLPDDWLETGERSRRRGMDRIAEGIASGDWPAYASGVQLIAPPPRWLVEAA